MSRRHTTAAQFPSAHLLFKAFLEAIDYERYTLVDWLVSPETDCLTYLLVYAKRVAASGSATWSLPRAYLCQAGRVEDLFEGLSGSLQRLYADGSLPFSPDLLCDRLLKAAYVLRSLDEK